MKHLNRNGVIRRQQWLGKGRLAAIVLVCSACFSTQAGWAAESTAAAEVPFTVHSMTRETDYTIGDIARQTVHVRVPSGYVLDPASLPQVMHNEAIELRQVHWAERTLPDGHHYTLRLDWQIFVAAEAVKSMPLKPLHLVFKRDGQTLNVPVPADKVLVSSLLPPKMDEAHVALYPDAPLPRWSLLATLQGVVVCVVLFALSLLYLSWYAGWLTLPQERRMPFRQAWREIRRLPDKQAHVPQAMRLLSRAMDQFAGQTITIENLPVFLHQQPRLAEHAVALQAFYQDLQQTFFAGQVPRHGMAALRQLGRQLSQLEVS